MRQRLIYPHCDARILHKRKECRFCDELPNWQELRETWGINFTGHYDPEKSKCPSEEHRDLKTIEMWPGNRSVPKNIDHTDR